MRATRPENVRRQMAARAEAQQAHHTRLLEIEIEGENSSDQLCPNVSCGILVMRISGCNHITCICGQNFCFECGLGCDSAHTTYDHMMTMHKRMYYDEVVSEILSDEEDLDY